jgi:hypothetical protein
MDFLTQVANKLNPPPADPGREAQLRPFGIVRQPLSDDAKSELRGMLVSLRSDLRSARGGDRATQLHVAGAVRRIDEILDPRK